MSGLKAGDLRHRITIEAPEVIDGPYREEVWKVYRENVAAKVTFLSTKEIVASGAELSEVKARIQVRYDKSINAKMRIKFRDELYEIEGVMPDNESGLQWMTVFVTRGVTDF
ncbi:phage head closure protein [Ignatzschineria cameli]|uniref:Head-tail adaptor protein n=1 Tax=Ignatzschineria cameli TaxID=2182793 RepID=A0A2U2AQB8_9GAMM|nr:phage head closure protein [Ignatzschineria cameli]PWD85809.1 head-tail adaptor protein [Ignatzschineria cameli]PWD89437.1 head-tail adaptor protein [Ignatzschineria cameli]PWD90909.1 head-tail adaptor protein [Ignatzschineria cameli]PWD91697.1 head-tail adaptor protein [Ignatzschineria cameli]